MINRLARTTRSRLLGFEALEPRLTLAAAGLVPVGTQPVGGLSGKIAYIGGGHGTTADNVNGGAWSFQRGELFEMIEDLGNQDQMTFLADQLFRAGATVVPFRPVGHQTNEVVLDNDDPGVTFFGPGWTNSSSSVYFGSAGDVPYRYVATSASETAYARYQPNIPEAGFYPVYAWTRAGTDRATDQLYRITSSGGTTEVKVNHRRVGNGMIYLGTYYFEAGTGGYVDISNRSNSAGSIVVADMIRFGNGMGDIDRGAGVSGLSREDEAALYWIKWEVDHSQGISSSTYLSSGLTKDLDQNVGAPPRYAAYMNVESDGALKDRVFVSYHSNASGGRGVLGLYNGNNIPSTATPNQFLLANTLGLEVNNDMVAQNGQFEHNWFDAGTNVTLDRSDIEFGEINNSYINNEFDATIIEVAYHDNQLDAELMRDPKVRDAVARATYQGLIKYFRAVDNNATPATQLPDAVTGVHAESNTAGSVTISWLPPAVNAYAGDVATGYRIYASTNGYGFDGGTFVSGGATSSVTLTGYDPKTPYYLKVVAVNAGGESPGSEVLAVLPSGGAKQVLIVNGFDRLTRQQDPKQPYGGGGNTVDRVRPRQSNSRDYVTQVEAAIQTAAPGMHVNSTSNEAVISGAVNLTEYNTVIWILGEESSADHTFDSTEQTKTEQFIAGGGNLFVTGAEIAWDLDHLNNGRSFYQNTLKGTYVADDANTYSVNGAAGGIFAGMSISFDNGAQFYDSEYPDVINPQAGAQTALTYANGAGGAGIQVVGTGSRGRIVMFGFPFETITTAANRASVIGKVFGFFNLAPSNPDLNRNGTVDAGDYVVWRKTKNTNVPPGTSGDADGNGKVNDADYSVWRSQFGIAVPASGSSPAGGNDVLALPNAPPASAATPAPPIGIATTQESNLPARDAGPGALSAPTIATHAFNRRSAGSNRRLPPNADRIRADLLNVLADRGQMHEAADDLASTNATIPSLEVSSDVERPAVDELLEWPRFARREPGIL